MQVTVVGADSEAEAAKIARSVAASSLLKVWIKQISITNVLIYKFGIVIGYFNGIQAAIYGRDPNWGRIACAAGYAGIPFDQKKLRVVLGDILLMESGEPQSFDR